MSIVNSIHSMTPTSITSMTPESITNEIKHITIKTSELVHLTQLDLLLIASSFGLIFMCYWFVEIILSSSKKFSDLPFDRKRYVIKNLIKAVYLYMLTLCSVIFIKNMLLYDIWDNNTIKVMGMMYCLPDLLVYFGFLICKEQQFIIM